jgi:tetratricopeptide (TPR) repeat protein
MARAICQAPRLKEPDYALALQLTRQACALSRNGNARHLGTAAEVYFKSKDFNRAVQTQEQAVEVAKKQADGRPLLESLAARLEQFKEMKKKTDDKAVAAKPEQGTRQ